MKGFTSRILHTQVHHSREYGALRTPIYNNAAFEFESCEELANAFSGKTITPVYSRTANPTISAFEARLVQMSNASYALALSSGMAAITNIIMTVCASGDNIIVSPYLFGNTYSCFEETFRPWGLEIRYADMHQPSTIETLIDSRTRLIFLESIANPQMIVFDLPAIGQIAHKHQVLLVLDNTTLTPYLLEAKQFGVNLEILSTTKYISGGGSSIGGAILDYGNYDWARVPKLKELSQQFGPMAFFRKLRREIYRNLGACLSPDNAYLQTLGMETMALRIERSCANALQTAEYLQKMPQVKKVHYPGLPDNPYHELAKKICRAHYGGILAFELEDQQMCFQFMDKLKMIRRATNLNDNKSLIIHPYSTIFCEYTPEVKEKLKISDRLIRLSLGIEDMADILDDLHQASQ
jgi:O-acetylhomoserine (thiol)-lyase